MNSLIKQLLIKEMIGKWNYEFRKVNLIKEIKLGLWLKASFYDNSPFFWKWKRLGYNFRVGVISMVEEEFYEEGSQVLPSIDL